MVESAKWSFLVHYRRPLLAESSVVDWLRFSQSPVVVIHGRNYFANKIRTKIGGAFEVAEGFESAGKIRFVHKRTERHEPELDLIAAILSDKWHRLEGLTLAARQN